MIRYVIKRILLIIPVVLAVAIVIFTIMYFCPGDPAELTLGRLASEEALNQLRAEMGLDKPYIVQLGTFMYNAFIRFDFGTSFITGKSVIQEIGSRFSITLVLAIATIVLEVIIGIPLGMVAATHRNKLPDYLCMFIAIVGVSIPGFWLGLELIILFAIKLKWLPTYGITSWTGWILPIVVSSVNAIARMARQSRSSMLEVIRSDFIKTGRSKGLPERQLLFKYALPNALIPLIQTLGNSFGQSIGGTVIVESIFSLPGMGKYMVDAIANRDYPVIRSTVIILSIAFCLIMLIVDLAFAFVDPRIKAQYESQGKLSMKRRKANA